MVREVIGVILNVLFVDLDLGLFEIYRVSIQCVTGRLEPSGQSEGMSDETKIACFENIIMNPV